MDQVEICVAAICAKQDGLMWLQLLKGCFLTKDKNIDQVGVCVAAIRAKQDGLMCMHLFEKEKWGKKEKKKKKMDQVEVCVAAICAQQAGVQGLEVPEEGAASG